MTAVEFRNLRCNDINPPLSVEDMFKRYGSWAGIHDFNFDTLFDVLSVGVTGTSTGWSSGFIEASLPPNFTVKYHKTQLRQGIVISSDTPESYLLMIGTDSSGYPELRYSNSEIVQKIPKVTPTEADVEIVFRQQMWDDVNPAVWITATLYMNGKWITTLTTQSTIALSTPQVGFMAYSTDIVDYTNITIPELCDTVGSNLFGNPNLLPGEAAINGLQQAIEGRYLKFYVRFDGSLRAWKRRQRDQVMTIANDLEGIKRGFDLPNLITHARMMGAYIWSEDKDDDLIRAYGHRFAEVNNSMLGTAKECLEEASNEIKRSKENSFTLTTQARHIPILEPEDRVTIDGEDWIINDYSFSGSPGRLVQTYNCRSYVWGS